MGLDIGNVSTHGRVQYVRAGQLAALEVGNFKHSLGRKDLTGTLEGANDDGEASKT